MDGFTMPPAIAGDNNEITPDGDGASNFVSVSGGLAAVALAATAGGYVASRVMNVAGVDEESQVSLSVS